jgi:leucyl-tRNA synthetase
MQGVRGVRGFLDRVWRLIVDERSETMELNAAVQDVEPTDEQNRVLHRTIMAVTRDIEQLQFNTAIARMMEFVNHFTKQATRPRRTLESFVLLVSPFAPHLAEELWEALGRSDTLAYEAWPEFDAALTKEDTIEVPVQVGKKVRAKISVPADATQEQLEQAARAHEKVAELLVDKQVVKVIVVPGRLVNFVIR